ncbi:MAG: type II toxin-antitoxin system Phd/YefM family antitoxin [Chloroflexi bacterium]|nr:type II toxin-antitoxin system Phd/YefM family antitoxin [Chloroflexota bacterium]
MENVVSVTEARIHLGELMRKVVETGQPVVVARAGKPQVVMVSVKKFEQMQEFQETTKDWRALVAQARTQIKNELGGQLLPAPEKIIQQMREKRDAQLLDNLR